ncbi:hypothetical protein [Paenibacillus sp. sgz302251]|uniref:hypothetical protein n=1 Tax=Paenibacillus sp. sgz302251 TaxID=3414493 RepID=UPI003C7C2F8F
MRVFRTFYVCLIFMIIAGSILAFPKDVLACTCVDPGAVLERKDRSHAVFEGTVTAVKDSSSLFLSSAKAVKASFQVHEVWKGQVAPTIDVLTAEGEENCAYPFLEGERYLVYARDIGNSLEASLCSGTLHESESSEHLAFLGGGSIPPQLTEPNTPKELATGLIILMIILLVGATAAILIVYRKKKGFKLKT